MQQLTASGGVRLAYQDSGGDKPALVLLHGLTTNSHQFDGLQRAGLTDSFRVIAVDLRGRGQSGKPPIGYTQADHAADIDRLIATLGLADVILAGHSFGGMLAMYMGAHYAARLSKLVIMDAALALANPAVADAIQPLLDRLGRTIPSVEDHLANMRALPMYAGAWDDDIEAMYRADVEPVPAGGVRSRSTAAAIKASIDGVINENWRQFITAIQLPTLLIRGTDAYGPPGAAPLLRADAAQETVDLLRQCTYHEVGGNHNTMVFGANAKRIVTYIRAFAG